MDSATINLIITTLLTLVQSFMNLTGVNNSLVNQIIAGLTTLEPMIEKLGPLALQSIQAIIATVKAGTGNTLTDAQLNTLDSISDQVDAAWDAAWASFAAAKNINTAAATSGSPSTASTTSAVSTSAAAPVVAVPATIDASPAETDGPLASAG